MSGLVLAVNAGSSTLKLSLVDEGGRAVDRRDVDGRELGPWEAGLQGLLSESVDIRAVGHRIVHGGPSFSGPVALTDEVLAQIEAVAELAPLHNAPALAAVRLARRLSPVSTPTATARA